MENILVDKGPWYRIGNLSNPTGSAIGNLSILEKF